MRRELTRSSFVVTEAKVVLGSKRMFGIGSTSNRVFPPSAVPAPSRRCVNSPRITEKILDSKYVATIQLLKRLSKNVS